MRKKPDEMELALVFNHLEALKSDPAMTSHIEWVKKQRVLAY